MCGFKSFGGRFCLLLETAAASKEIAIYLHHINLVYFFKKLWTSICCNCIILTLHLRLSVLMTSLHMLYFYSLFQISPIYTIILDDCNLLYTFISFEPLRCKNDNYLNQTLNLKVWNLLTICFIYVANAKGHFLVSLFLCPFMSEEINLYLVYFKLYSTMFKFYISLMLGSVSVGFGAKGNLIRSLRSLCWRIFMVAWWHHRS